MPASKPYSDLTGRLRSVYDRMAVKPSAALQHTVMSYDAISNAQKLVMPPSKALQEHVTSPPQHLYWSLQKPSLALQHAMVVISHGGGHQRPKARAACAWEALPCLPAGHGTGCPGLQSGCPPDSPQLPATHAYLLRLATYQPTLLVRSPASALGSSSGAVTVLNCQGVSMSSTGNSLDLCVMQHC